MGDSQRRDGNCRWSYSLKGYIVGQGKVRRPGESGVLFGHDMLYGVDSRGTLVANFAFSTVQPLLFVECHRSLRLLDLQLAIKGCDCLQLLNVCVEIP